MRCIVFVKANADTEAGKMPSAELLAAMTKFNAALAGAGVLLAGDGLRPSARGARVRFAGKERRVLDGPFTQSKELVAGYWLWQVRSLEEAIEWAKRCPNPTGENGELEIRPVYEAEDFAIAPPPDSSED